MDSFLQAVFDGHLSRAILADATQEQINWAYWYASITKQEALAKYFEEYVDDVERIKEFAEKYFSK